MANTTLEKWEEKTLGEIAYIKGGKRLPKGEKLSTEKTNHPYIRVTDFNDKGTVDIDNVQFITNDIYEQIKNYTISSCDLYISIAGTIGKAGIIPQELDGANLTENACKLVYKSKDILNKYIYYYTQTNMFAEQIFDKTKMAAMPKLALTRLATVKLLVPPLLEQQRIVAKLDKAFEAIDKVKANAEQNLNNAKELFESALDKAFTENTEGWEEKTLEKIGNIQTGTTPRTSEKDNFGNYIPFIKPADFNSDGTLNYNNEGLSEKGLKQSRFIPKHSVLMVCIGTVGKTGYCDIDIACNQQINTLTPKTDNYKFLYYAMIRKSFQSKILLGCPQTTLPIINKTNWSLLTLKMPSLSEQQNIVRQLDKLQEQTKQLEAIYTQKIKECDELKQSILQKAFRGEL